MQEHRPTPPQGQRPMGQPQGVPHSSSGGPPRIAAPPVQKLPQVDLEPIELIDEDPVEVVPGAPAGAPPGAGVPHVTQGPSKIRQFGTSIGSVTHQEKFTRPTTVTGKGATRIRTFHGRLSDEGLIYMDAKINEWIDGHPDVEVKFVTTTVGLYEGKIKEQALIVNVWY